MTLCPLRGVLSVDGLGLEAVWELVREGVVVSALLCVALWGAGSFRHGPLFPRSLFQASSPSLLTFVASDVARSASVEGLTVDLVEGLQQSGDSLDIVMPSSGQSFSADTASMVVDPAAPSGAIRSLVAIPFFWCRGFRFVCNLVKLKLLVALAPLPRSSFAACCPSDACLQSSRLSTRFGSLWLSWHRSSFVFRLSSVVFRSD